MAYYTNITLNEANTILNLYNLPMAKALTPIGHGISNSNYIVTLEDASEVVLKISNDKNDQQLLSEQNILLNLEHLGFTYSPVPIKTKSGNTIYKCPPWHGVLFPKMRGVVSKPSIQVCTKIGETLATLHLLASEKKLQKLPYPVREAKDISYFPDDIEQFLQNPNCPGDFKTITQQVMPSSAFAFYHSLENNLPRSIIHGDLYFDNTLFDQSNLITMLDFEQAGIGPCVFDLGISISGSCIKDKQLDETLVKNFLKGYLSKRKLELSEIELLYHQVIIGFLSISLWRIDRFYLGNLSAERKMSYQELLQYAHKTAQTFSPTWFEETVEALS